MSALTFQRASSDEILFRLIFLVAASSTLIVTTTFLDPVNLPKLVAIVALLPALFLYLLKILGLPTVRIKEFPQFIFLISILVIVSYIFISPAPILTRFFGISGRNNGLLINLVFLVTAWCAYEVSKRGVKPIRFCLWAHQVLLVAGLYGLMQILGLDPIEWSTTDFTAFATFGNPNFASSAFGLGAMCSTSLLLFRGNLNIKSKLYSVFYASTLILFLFLAFSTRSIQGLFAYAAFFTLTIIFFLWSRKKLIYKLVSLVPIVMGLVIAHSIYFSGPLSTYIVGAGNLELRKWYWNIGWHIFLDHPIFGAGVDSYGSYFRSTRSEEMVRSTFSELFTNNAHNSFIQSLATLGIFGGIAVILPVALTLMLSLRHALRASSSSSFALIAIFMALWLNSAFSIDNISIALWNWLFLGAALGSIMEPRLSRHESEQGSKKGRVKNHVSNSAPIVQIFSILLSVTLLVFLLASVTSADRKLAGINFSGQVPENQKNAFNSERIRILNLVSSDKYLNALHFFTIARTYEELGQTSRAIDTLRTGLERFPNDNNLIDFLAQILEVKGRPFEAIEIRKLQASLDPYYAIPWAALAGSYFRIGDEVNGRKAADTAYKYLLYLSDSNQENVRSFLKQFD